MHDFGNQISARQVRTLLEAENMDTVLLDCREPAELALARIDGAVHVPMNETPDRLSSLDAHKQIVVFCHHGVRSRHVAAFLRQHGFANVTDMAGGIDAWSVDVDPSVPRY